MKKVGFIIFSLINLIFITDVNAASNPYSSTSSYGVNCTWYAWNMAYQKAGVALPGWGNAKDWYNDAINSGYSVGSTPRANSIVVWGTWTSYGHVGYVESVSGDTLYVWDSANSCIVEDEEYKNCIVNGVSQESDIACRNNAKQGPCEYSTSAYYVTGYIYLDTPPKTTTSTTTSSNTTAATKEEVKSNNSYLSSITLSTGEIEFNKDTLNYDITVENSIDKINVDATLEDEKATINGLGEYDLEVGINIIYIDVTAEDTTLKEYVISVTREEEAKEEKVTIKKETAKAEDNSKQNIIVYLGITGMVIVLSITVFLIVKKYKNKKRNIKK